MTNQINKSCIDYSYIYEMFVTQNRQHVNAAAPRPSSSCWQMYVVVKVHWGAHTNTHRGSTIHYLLMHIYKSKKWENTSAQAENNQREKESFTTFTTTILLTLDVQEREREKIKQRAPCLLMMKREFFWFEKNERKRENEKNKRFY